MAKKYLGYYAILSGERIITHGECLQERLEDALRICQIAVENEISHPEIRKLVTRITIEITPKEV